MVVKSVILGTFLLDGGAMFGVVPKSIWSHLNPADENNLCTWGLNSILIDTGDKKILVDTGIGTKQDAKFRSHFHPVERPIEETIVSETMINVEEITDVFLTHLHFDHVGGAVKKIGEKYVPTFPNAKYWTNKVQYDWAYKGNPREKASFLHENFVPLQEANVLEYIDVQSNDLEWYPSIYVRTLYGHTQAMMMIYVKQENKTIYFPSDLLPTQWHARIPYILSYDIYVEKTMEEKERLLNELEEEERYIYFQHDPLIKIAKIIKNEKGRYESICVEHI